MQRFIYIFMIFASSLAADVYVYDDRYYTVYNAEPVIRSVAPWKFGYNSNDRLHIYYKNKLPIVTAVRVSLESVSGRNTMEKSNVTYVRYSGKIVAVTVYHLTGPEAIINLYLYTSNGLCAIIRVAEGKAVSTVRPKIAYKYADICFKGSTKPCVIVVDIKEFTCKGPSINKRKNGYLKTTTIKTIRLETNSSANDTETNCHQPPTQNNGLIIYMIPSLIGVCVIILVIYICVKKYSHRNSHQVETMELNTYATTNEVVYADLTLMHGDNQPPRVDEESPYAEIIGVLHPL